MLRRLIALFLLLISLSSPLRAETSILFYNPDTNSKTLEWMQATTRAYLKLKLGQVSFQPVTKIKNLERLIATRKPEALIISSLYVPRARLRYKLKCHLMPQRNNMTRFRKVLVTHNKKLVLNGLKGLSLATTSAGETGKQWLQENLIKPLKLDNGSLRIISVSKDIDALFALSFAQVDLALVTPENIQVLGRVNPGSVRGLRVIFKSKPIPFPPLCTVATPKDGTTLEKLKRAFLQMHLHALGRKALHMMGFDRWVPIPKDGLKR